MAFKRSLSALLFALALTGCDQEVYHNLSQRDANEMIAVLEANGVHASREGENANYRIMVAEAAFPRAVELLSRLDYPRETYRSIEDVFPGDRMIQTPFEQRARLSFAIGQELARSISLLDGAVFARVHVVLPETDIRGAPRGKSSASVVIRHRAGADAANLSVQAKGIVVSGVQGLDYKDISVVLTQMGQETEPKMATPVEPAILPPLLHDAPRTWIAGGSIAAFVAFALGAFLLLRRPTA